MKQLDIVLVGVGGQGTLLASRVLGTLAIDLGLDVKVSEVHGMAQRGGSVVTYVRMGEQPVYSPLVELGNADYVVSFEKLEALRALSYLKEGGTVITNTQEIAPMPVITGAAQYPGDVMERLHAACRVVALDALSIAQEVGELRAVNLVLLGVLAKETGYDKAAWLRAVERSVPRKVLAVNVEAFERGYAL